MKANAVIPRKSKPRPRTQPFSTDDLLTHAREASNFLKALSHEARLLILCVLSEGECSVTQLEEMLNLRQPAVSQQLARLRADDLVETRRDGKNIYYSLSRPEVREVVGALQRAFCSRPAGEDPMRSPPSVGMRDAAWLRERRPSHVTRKRSGT
jgi:DNA-binding transcriptional ArsR family regulator